MTKLMYYWSKFCKKIRLKAIYESEIDKRAHIAAGCHIYKSKIGKYTAVGYDCQIIHCEIGNFCSLAGNIVIGGADHPTEWVSTSQVFVKLKDSISKKFSPHEYNSYKSTFIGNDVWIGDSVLIKAGVKISDGAVIGMGSVVTKDVGPYEIWAGNPARIIRKRFDEHTIQELLKSKWFTLSDEKIDNLAIDINKPDLFMERINK